MKENVLDVLMYLFENYMEDETDEAQTDRETLFAELEEAGFPAAEITKAFQWLEDLADSALPGETASPSQSLRVYSSLECERMSPECRGFVIYLEQIGILDAGQRERVLDRIMALESPAIDLDQVKWIVLMLLFNQPGQEEEYARMEDLVFEEAPGRVH
jgi:Smg protein